MDLATDATIVVLGTNFCSVCHQLHSNLQNIKNLKLRTENDQVQVPNKTWQKSSEQLIINWVQQGHVFSTFDWKLVDCIMVNHLWDAVERLAKLAKNVVSPSATTAIITAHDLHVHKTSRTPANSQITAVIIINKRLTQLWLGIPCRVSEMSQMVTEMLIFVTYFNESE